MPTPTAPTAVTYLRVSTTEQARRGGRDEGYSLPDQRRAVERKAQSMGAVVVEEFVEPGESGKSLSRRNAVKTHKRERNFSKRERERRERSGGRRCQRTE